MNLRSYDLVKREFRSALHMEASRLLSLQQEGSLSSWEVIDCLAEWADRWTNSHTLPGDALYLVLMGCIDGLSCKVEEHMSATGGTLH